MIVDLEAIRHALHRSWIRVAVLIALLRLDGPATTGELSRLTRASARGVRGGLRGDGRRYRVEDSLLALGLVETVVFRGREYYRLTEKGTIVARAWQRETFAELGRMPRVKA